VAPLEELPALVHYPCDTPDAQSALADRRRLETLIVELRTKRWQDPRPPGEPLLGDRLDTYVAVNKALHAAGWRLFGRRPVRGESTPDAHDVTHRVRVLLAHGVSERVSDDELLQVVERHLHVGAWPFDVLLT
jgi:hypothetical protein